MSGASSPGGRVVLSATSKPFVVPSVPSALQHRDESVASSVAESVATEDGHHSDIIKAALERVRSALTVFPYPRHPSSFLPPRSTVICVVALALCFLTHCMEICCAGHVRLRHLFDARGQEERGVVVPLLLAGPAPRLRHHVAQ